MRRANDLWRAWAKSASTCSSMLVYVLIANLLNPS
jgi:hypothetical protein